MDSPERYRTGDLRAGLADVRAVNRYLGGAAIALDFLRDRPELRPGAAATLLDVATGSADIPLALLRWAERRGVRLDVLATDLSPEIVACASEYAGGRPALRCEAADALALPYPDGSFDYATCNMALHHFGPTDAARVIAELWRVAHRAILVNDLRRSRPAYWGARLLFGVGTDNVLSSHDGPLSVRRAYTVDELRALGRAAGIGGAIVRPRPVFRLELRGERPRGGAR